ncbi:MAG: ParB/Srx family N-terminal domain-containing protein [Methyloceanibacter sp.]
MRSRARPCRRWFPSPVTAARTPMIRSTRWPRSITEWGWTNPVLIAEDGTIIAGHARVLAAQKLGLAEVPVMVARGWSEAQIRAYVIADNKLAENAGWDNKMLVSELQELSGGFDL